MALTTPLSSTVFAASVLGFAIVSSHLNGLNINSTDLNDSEVLKLSAKEFEKLITTQRTEMKIKYENKDITHSQSIEMERQLLDLESRFLDANAKKPKNRRRRERAKRVEPGVWQAQGQASVGTTYVFKL